MTELATVRNRLSAVVEIRSICDAMATVAAAKLSASRQRAIGLRLFTERIREVLSRQILAANVDGVVPEPPSPLMMQREVSRVLLLVVGTDQGLCGGYNQVLDLEVRSAIEAWMDRGIRVTALVRGLKTARALRRRTDVEIAGETPWPRSGVLTEDVSEIAEEAKRRFLQLECDEVWVVFTGFVSSISGRSRAVRLFPVPVPDAPEGAAPRFFYEHSRASAVDELLQTLCAIQVEDAMVEGFASEQSARMITMQEATERADTAIADLRMRFNRLRRESITTGISDVLAARRTFEDDEDG